MATEITCIACRSDDVRDLIRIDQIPVLCNELHNTRESALATPTASMHLMFCAYCGHYFNAAFNEDDIYYSENYDTSLYASDAFRDYADDLVARLKKTYELEGKFLLEIGCGRGEFLRHLCADESNRGIGFDTSVLYEGIDPDHPKVSFVRDYFSSKHDQYEPDLIVIQQVLEHIADPIEFLSSLSQTRAFNAKDPVIYCEVPNGLWTAEALGIWDLIYEHVSYFTPGSLSRLFEAAGFEILNSGVSYGGQYLFLEARLTGEVRNQGMIPEEERVIAAAFATHYKEKVEKFQALVESDAINPEETIVWGAGSKGITFCNIVDAEGRLAGLIDRNSFKHNKYIGGTALQIFDLEKAPTLSSVFVMNPQYADEIREDLARHGMSAELISV